MARWWRARESDNSEHDSITSIARHRSEALIVRWAPARHAAWLGCVLALFAIIQEIETHAHHVHHSLLSVCVYMFARCAVWLWLMHFAAVCVRAALGARGCRASRSWAAGRQAGMPAATTAEGGGGALDGGAGVTSGCTAQRRHLVARGPNDTNF